MIVINREGMIVNHRGFCKLTFVLLLITQVWSNACARVSPQPMLVALLGTTTSTIPLPTLSYSNSSYTFTNATPISALTPIVSSSPTSCSISPSLPTGLSISTSCVISGTPTSIQSATLHTITAEMQEGTATTTLSITVNGNTSSAKAITSFQIVSPATTGFITGNNISVIVPFGTSTTSLVATFTTTGSSVRVNGTLQISGTTTNNFSTDVSYVVTASDGSTSTYIVSLTVASNTAKDITSFRFSNSLQTIFTGTNISVLVPNGTNLSSLVAIFTTTGTIIQISGTTQVSGTTSNDFSTARSYVVTAGDSSTRTFTVTVTAAAASDKDITSFGFVSPAIKGSISGSNIAVTVPFGTDVTSLVATFSSSGSSVSVSGVSQVSGSSTNNFSSTVSYTVTAADTSTKVYSVTVTIAASVNSAIVNGSFQSGTITNVINTSTATLSNPVDMTKSFVYCGARIQGSAAANMITCQLTSPTTVSVTSGQSSATGTTANWFVVEYASGVNVQRGTTNLSSGAAGVGNTFQNVTISSINLSKSFVIVYSKTSTTSTALDEERTVMGYFNNSTTLRLERQVSSTMSTTIEWQVVEFNGANVQSSGTSPLELAATTSVVNYTLPSSVDLTKSFLLFSINGSSGVIGREAHLYTRGQISNANTISFNRRGNANVSVQISWFVIEMTDGTKVQSGSTTLNAGGGTTVNATLGTALNTAKTMIVWSNDTQGASNNANDNTTQDSGTYSAQLTSTTQLQFERNNDETNGATIDWFTVEFQ